MAGRKCKGIALAAVLAVSLLAPLSSSPAAALELKQVSIAGAGTAGTFYIMAAGIADLFGKQLGVNSVAEVTAGSVENVKLLDSKRVELAVMQVDVMQNALAGKAQFKSPVDMTAIAPLYPNVIQIVTLKDSPINSFAVRFLPGVC
ncbi:TAXI family TRAP transporter solute-binding subunit [Aminivibrio sp.]|uniref:TAXI family TRAP transporter solute-binding subunit n=1 Tax=Aminivibrio sp. TaxID=1872489 RepID=UPI003D976059